MSARATLANVPNNVGDNNELRRFLTKLVEQLNVALGNLSTEALGDVSVANNTESAVGQYVENPVSLAGLNDNLLQDAIADTSGATLIALETQVNDILAKLRLANILKS